MSTTNNSCSLLILGVVTLQSSTKNNSRETFKKYTKHTDEVNKSVTLRGVLKLKVDRHKSIPLSEVEDARSIVKRFNTGAMSLGSISAETHEALAVAMNSIGARSNTGLSARYLCSLGRFHGFHSLNLVLVS